MARPATNCPERIGAYLHYHRRYKTAKHRKNRAYALAYKSRHGCADCGESRAACLDFHHLDPASKLFGISQGCRSKTLCEIACEIRKCAVLCKNCHALRHEAEFSGMRDEQA